MLFRSWMPESFEYLILKSGLISTKELSNILVSTSDYVESEEYESWERYFTHLLISMTSVQTYSYSKKVLNPFYLQDKSIQKIAETFPEAVRNLRKE